jgi:radical SAM protein with 4Fe4S-binding SPASM domain
MTPADERSAPPETVARLTRLMLWINSGCNARCRMCDIWREKPGRNLTVADIEQWSPQWRRMGVQTVVVCGESLMHPEVWPIVRGVKAHGIRLELLSNGLLLARYATEVAAHCDVLRVSLDGPREIHDRMRNVPHAYDRLRRGLTALHEHSPDYPVDGRCAVHRQNFRHLARTVTAAKELGLRGISFSATDVYNEEAFRRFGAIDAAYIDGLVIRGADLGDLETELAGFQEEMAEDFASGFISDTPAELRELLLGYYRSIDGGPARTIRCNAPWTSAVIEYDGTLRPCFPMPAYGNLHDHDTVEAAVNTPQARGFRRDLDVLNHPTCRRCVDQSVNPLYAGAQQAPGR